MKKLIYFGKFIWQGSKEIARCAFLGIVVPLCMMLGLCVLIDTYFIESPTPTLHSLNGYQRGQAYMRRDLLCQEMELAGEDPNWIKLQGALLLLDECCPEISAWVRKQHDAGCIVNRPDCEEYLACYNWILRRLTITECVYSFNDFTKAEILGHEFIHSQQGLTCHLKRTLANFIFLKNPQDRTDPFLESPAYTFQDRLHDALTRW